MHDVHRDTLLHKGKSKNIKKGGDLRRHQHPHDDSPGGHDQGREYHHDHHHDHRRTAAHNHQQEAQQRHHHHNMDTPHGHTHNHDEAAYENHEHDAHRHSHVPDRREDRAFTHIHEHGHNFFHSHHHTHHPEHTTMIHRMFGDPLRDWFAVLLMAILIGIGYFNVLPETLSSGMLLCAAVIGIFPLLKNALFKSIARRRFSLEILLGVLLMGGLLRGNFLPVALISFCLLVGSFLRLDFSWKRA